MTYAIPLERVDMIRANNTKADRPISMFKLEESIYNVVPSGEENQYS